MLPVQLTFEQSLSDQRSSLKTAVDLPTYREGFLKSITKGVSFGEQLEAERDQYRVKEGAQGGDMDIRRHCNFLILFKQGLGFEFTYMSLWRVALAIVCKYVFR